MEKNVWRIYFEGMHIVSKDSCNNKKMVVILGKFNVLCLSYYFEVYFSKLELIFFYHRVIADHT